MPFPPYQVPWLGNGMVIGVNAVVHMLISHGVAIGALALIAWSERIGLTRNSKEWDEFARRTLRAAVIVITSVGAVTGVGIWLTTTALAPRAIGSMLRVFFWPWFAEWMVFLAEVVVLLVYYYTWDRWTGPRKRQHVRLGFAYTGLACTSALLITGIIAFMLTPGNWPSTRRFWAAFLNPTFVPQLILRLAASFVLGAVLMIGAALVNCTHREVQREAMTRFARVLLVSISIAVPTWWWYFSVVPPNSRSFSMFSVLTSHFREMDTGLLLANAAGVVVILLLAVAAWRGKLKTSRVAVAAAASVCILYFAEFERLREFIRGPYLMPGYMYANQILIAEHPYGMEHGGLAGIGLLDIDTADSAGSRLFAAHCSSCHTLRGINSISDRLHGRSEDGVHALLGHTQEMVPFMPPFSGNAAERRILANFLHRWTNGEVQTEFSGHFSPKPSNGRP